jgi:FG-GAP-like repeat/ASPIC and UnbV
VEAPVHSFPIVPLDFDNDGFLDLFCSGFSGSYGAIRVAPAVAELLGLPTEVDKARLFRNRGDGTFADVSAAMGLERVLFAMGANTGDFDNDGWPDLYLGTGAPDYQVLVPNRAFRNDGGRRFLDVTSSAGLGHLQKGHGIAFADFDRDGDQDIYAVMGGAFSGDRAWNVLFENPGTPGHHFVSLELEGRRSNRAAIGARLELEVEENGARRRIHAVVSSGGSFGASSLAQEIGLGRATRIERLEILWPSGEKQVFVDLKGDAFYRIVEGDPQSERLIRPAFTLVGSEPGHVGH